jgi:opacity protein-like surface antigen
MKRSIVLILALAAQTHASSWHPILAIGGGFTNTITLGKSVVFPIMDPNRDEYYIYNAAHRSQTNGLFEAFLAVERPIFSQWLLQAGCAYTQAATFMAQGSLIQGVDPQSQDQYGYQYNVASRQVMLQTKWMRPMRERFYPYALLGLGAAVNTASNYATTVPYTLSYTRLYQDNTATTCAYRLGVGVDMDLTAHLRLGIAYRIADLGGVSLGSASIDKEAVNGTLSQSTVYANEVLAQLTYRI